MSAEVFIGFGGNLGEVRASFDHALEAIKGFAQVEKISSIYRSKPYGFEDQPDFLNAAAKVTTKLDPQSLLAELQVIETDLGKEILRENGPRAIDLDLLFYGDLVIKTEELEIPHPGIPERDFVLLPLSELAPDFMHPALSRSVEKLREDLRSSYVSGSPEPWD